MKTKKEVKGGREKREDQIKEKTLKLSIREGSAAAVMQSIANKFIAPFALALNANNIHIGFLASVPSLLAPISQIFGSKLMEKTPRKKLVLYSVFIQALMWIPIIFLSLMFWKNLFVEYLPWMLIAIYSLLIFIGSLAAPAWFSMMGDIVPEKRRGRYFSKRNRVIGIVALITALGASFLLDYFKTRGLILLGFAILFTVAMAGRLFSYKIFRTHYVPRLKLRKGYYFNFFQFVSKLPYSDFGRFSIFLSLIYFAAALASPFFVVYMLKELSFSYKTYAAVGISSVVFSLIVIRFWGRFSDRHGSKELLKIGSILVSMVPFLWLLSKNPVFLILGVGLVGGTGWAALNLAVTNFTYDYVSPGRRGICVAYLNMLIGISIFLGATVGGFILQNIPLTNKFFFLFFLSGILRITGSFSLVASVKEKYYGKTKFISFLRHDAMREVYHEYAWFKKIVWR